MLITNDISLLRWNGWRGGGGMRWPQLKSVGEARLERVSPFDQPTWLDLVLEFSASQISYVVVEQLYSKK